LRGRNGRRNKFPFYGRSLPISTAATLHRTFIAAFDFAGHIDYPLVLPLRRSSRGANQRILRSYEMPYSIAAFVLALYWSAAAALLLLALLRPKHWPQRVAASTAVIVLFGAYPAKLKYEEWEYKKFSDAAAAHFKKRCAENAGERINKVFENVDSIFIAKPRVRADETSLRDQFWMGDPYGYSSYEADHPAAAYLYDRSGETITRRRISPIKGFKFVEMPNPDYTDSGDASKYLRYSLKNVSVHEGNSVVMRATPVAQPVSALRSRFALTWEDISTREDREFWVAGGSLKILDMQSKEIVAERIGYVVDPYLGRVRQARLIWLHVNRIPGAFCPPFETDFDKNKEFVAKVLRP
jgi:hypothetical protein